jgi:hypothetical protein
LQETLLLNLLLFLSLAGLLMVVHRHVLGCCCWRLGLRVWLRLLGVGQCCRKQQFLLKGGLLVMVRLLVLLLLPLLQL